MSFWSRTLIITRLGPSARTAGDSAVNAIKSSERRNITGFLLRFKDLSRRNCKLRPLGAEVDPGKPLTERGDRNVEKPDLEHGQEWHGNELPVLNREPNKVAE